MSAERACTWIASKVSATLELEIVLEENEPIAVVVEEARALMAKLGIEPSQLVEGAYIDLLAQHGAQLSNRKDTTLSA